MKRSLLLLQLLTVVVGCSFFGPNAKPPTGTERALFDVATNSAGQTELTPKPNVVVLTQTAGGVANLIAPGAGGLVAGILAGALGTWAKMRSKT